MSYLELIFISHFSNGLEKATNANLTAENWEYILDVCDKVNDDPEDGSKNAVKACSKRLETSNANVQLYTLTLVGSLAQNCGSKMQRELATKSFTSLLLKLAGDKIVYHTVKSKIAELMESLTKEFKSDPSLKVMGDAYDSLKQKGIQPPTKPQKHQMTEADKRKEEDELQMVLALSLSEQEMKPMTGHDGFQPSYQEQQNRQQQPQQESQFQTKPTGTTAATVTKVKALYDLTSTEEGELSFRKGDMIHVIESVYRDWWRGSLRGQVGIFPLNYVTPVAEPTKEELEREAHDELNVFAQSKNIEKLLAILSATDGRDGLKIAENEELQNLYHSTLAVRPKLVKLIDKYSQKKEELIQLNDKFISARKTYDNLMESSMSQYRTSAYQQPPPPQQQQQHRAQQTPQLGRYGQLPYPDDRQAAYRPPSNGKQYPARQYPTQVVPQNAHLVQPQAQSPIQVQQQVPVPSPVQTQASQPQSPPQPQPQHRPQPISQTPPSQTQAQIQTPHSQSPPQPQPQHRPQPPSQPQYYNQYPSQSSPEGYPPSGISSYQPPQNPYTPPPSQSAYTPTSPPATITRAPTYPMVNQQASAPPPFANYAPPQPTSAPPPPPPSEMTRSATTATTVSGYYSSQ